MQTAFYLIIAACLILPALFLARRSARLRSSGVRVVGRVVELTEDEDNRRTVYPLIEFEVPGETEPRRFRSGTGRRSCAIGDSFTLLHDRDDPSRVEIATFRDLWLGPIGLGCLGLCFVVAAAVAFLSAGVHK